MIRARTLLLSLVCLLVVTSGCGDETDLGEVYEAVSTDGSPWGGPSCAQFTIDGQFTIEKDCVEWALVQPCPSYHGTLYLGYREGLLHILLDWWEYDAGPVPPDHYARFRILTGDGEEQWDVRIYGNGSVQVILNGWEYGGIIDAAVGFGPSPQTEEAHAIFEVGLPVMEGPMYVGIQGPRNPPSNGSPGSDLIMDPYIYANSIPDNLKVRCPNAQGMLLLAISPPRGIGGDQVRLFGVGFGATQGQVRMGNFAAKVVSWAPYSIDVIVPPITQDVLTRVEAGDKVSNWLMFYYDCMAECGDECDPETCPAKTCGVCPSPTYCIQGKCGCEPSCNPTPGVAKCGSDGCDGSCGTCNQFTEYCSAEGLCLCQPQCAGGKECGPDGCGGVCGTCLESEVCNGGHCCQPDCENKQCGSNGCGSQCGVCPSKHTCDTGTCVCTPQCFGKTCGPDGCGGQCGACASPWVCQTGSCVCLPDCVGKSCGPDGCGGHCGDCPAAEICTKIGVCVGGG